VREPNRRAALASRDARTPTQRQRMFEAAMAEKRRLNEATSDRQPGHHPE
jgi:hypothetical protein